MGNYSDSGQTGAMLSPSSGSAVFIAAIDIDLDIRSSGYVHEIPFRESPIVVHGKGRHLESGVIRGMIRTMNADGTEGSGVSAYIWMNRLRELLANAANSSVTVSLTSRDFNASQVRFPEGARIRLVHMPDARYEVELPFQEVS